jgi:hypothetical protein
MSNKIIICQQSGTILYVEHCVIVDVDELSEQDQEEIFQGGDGDVLELAEQMGKELRPMLEGCGYGDLNYSNCIAFSPDAIQQELETNSEFLFGDHKEMAEYFTSLPKEALEDFANCLNSDYMWDTFTSEIHKEIQDQWEIHKEGN